MPVSDGCMTQAIAILGTSSTRYSMRSHGAIIATCVGSVTALASFQILRKSVTKPQKNHRMEKRHRFLYELPLVEGTSKLNKRKFFSFVFTASYLTL